MNSNLFIWTTDWHVGRQLASHTQGAASHIASLEPAGVIDTGDCKDHYGPSSSSELDDYISMVVDVLPWGTVNAGTGAEKPLLPGNHDEMFDYYPASSPDFSMFDSRLWGPPYHWTSDWQAPRLRFIGFHARVAHEGEIVYPYRGFFVVTEEERDWVAAELEALPDGWQAIMCAHPPSHPSFGAFVGHYAGYGGTELRTLFQQHASRITAYLGGHRHANMNTALLDGIRHFNGSSVSYSAGNGLGGFVCIDYASVARTLTFRYHYARTPFAAVSGYTPVVVQLPPLPNMSFYTFTAETTLVGNGPLSGHSVLASGTVEADHGTVTETTCAVGVA